MDDFDSNVNLLDVSQVVVHPDYEAPGEGAFANDLALLRLSAPQSQASTPTIPLAPASGNYSAGRPGQILGWGTTETGNTSDILLRGDVAVAAGPEENNCRGIPASPTLYNRTIMICANGPIPGTPNVVDACTGDSGGPLLTNQNGYPVLTGVTSWGVPDDDTVCSQNPDFPGVYVRVTSFLDWVGSNVTLPPAVPAGASAVAGNASAVVSWDPPVSGLENILSYTATSVPGGNTCVVSSPQSEIFSCEVSGLENGTSYTFVVTAAGNGGTSGRSAPSNAVTPVEPATPDIPGNVRVITGDSVAVVAWDPSGNTSGIVNYTVTATPGGATCSISAASNLDTYCSFRDLTNGVEYEFRVVASNEVGDSDPSAAATGVPQPATQIFVSTSREQIRFKDVTLSGGTAVDDIIVTIQDGQNEQGILNAESGVASNTGGAIDAYSVALDNVVVENNKGVFGGGVFGYMVEINNSSFVGNEALVAGGGVWGRGLSIAPHASDIQNSVFDGNKAGAGSALYYDSNSEVVIDSSTFADNEASVGGTVVLDSSVDTSVTNSTVSGNSGVEAAGIVNSGSGSTELVYLTVVDNVLTGVTAVPRGGQLVNSGAGLELTGTVLSGTSGPACLMSSAAEIATYNYVSDASCDLVGTGNIQGGGTAQFEELGNNGGLTPTRVPSPGNPVIGAIPQGACAEIGVDVDQREESRVGFACDMGSVQTTQTPPPPPPPPPPPVTPYACLPTPTPTGEPLIFTETGVLNISLNTFLPGRNAMAAVGFQFDGEGPLTLQAGDNEETPNELIVSTSSQYSGTFGRPITTDTSLYIFVDLPEGGQLTVTNFGNGLNMVEQTAAFSSNCTELVRLGELPEGMGWKIDRPEGVGVTAYNSDGTEGVDIPFGENVIPDGFPLVVVQVDTPTQWSMSPTGAPQPAPRPAPAPTPSNFEPLLMPRFTG